MSTVCVYSFADATGLTQYVDSDGDFIVNGTWSGSGTYFAAPLNAVTYGAAQYMCIRDNVGDNPQRVPTRTRPQSWSILSLLYEYQCGPGTLSPAEALAEAAWELAQTGTNIAWAAYYLAQIGTNTGSAAYALAGSAYAVGTDAYNLAGTAYALAGSAATDASYAVNVADSAYALAQIGTNTGTAALNAAASAQSTANGAFSIAVAGTNAAASAQSTADAAWALAQIGTNVGTAAYNLATSGSNLAWQAYLLASDTSGTDATARSTANAAYALAQIGTNTGSAAYNYAAAAYALAELGTIIPPLSTLPDVSIPAPTSNQVLGFNGSVWVAMDAPSQVAPGAFTLYLEETPSGTLTYDTLLAFPSGDPESVETAIVGGTEPFVLLESYLSSYLNRTRIDAGVWEFNTYASVGTLSANSVVEVYTHNISGIETFLFSGTSDSITSTSPAIYTTLITQGSYITSLTDKLLVKYYFSSAAPVSISATLYHSGTERDSHIHTPIGYAHNDLGGLQGGSTDEYYHTTLDQNDALDGNAGYPSGSNPYVTVAGLADVENTADAAYAIAISGSNTANDAFTIAVTGTNRAEAAYNLASIGTNTGTAAYQLAQSGSSVASAAYILAASGTHRACSMILCSAFTPASIGADVAEVPVPYAWDGSTVNWNANRFVVRVQTAGSSPSVAIEKSSGDGGFTAVSLGTVTLAMNAYEGSNIPGSGTVDSGDKLRFFVFDVGTAQNWTVAVELGV